MIIIIIMLMIHHRTSCCPPHVNDPYLRRIRCDVINSVIPTKTVQSEISAIRPLRRLSVFNWKLLCRILPPHLISEFWILFSITRFLCWCLPSRRAYGTKLCFLSVTHALWLNGTSWVVGVAMVPLDMTKRVRIWCGSNHVTICRGLAAILNAKLLPSPTSE